jgi:hypothetical protein
MGAGGGVRQHFNADSWTFDIRVPNPMPPAYALLPDGSGALARFRENDVELTMYRAAVFGSDVSVRFSHETYAGLTVAPYDPLMPIYGVARGQDEFAFFAHAVSGGEFMEVIFRPAMNVTLYNCVFSRFQYNTIYFQAFNMIGSAYMESGFQAFLDPPNQFDLTLHIEFLAGAGDTGFAANYVGMALYYRDFLLSTGQLTPPRFPRGGDIPLHMDILMSDVRRNLTGLTNIVVTTADDVDTMVNTVFDMGINDVSVALMGYKRNGLTGARIDRNRFSSAIGTRRDFENLVRRLNPLGADISFAQDYANINEFNASMSNHAVRHVGGRNVVIHLDALSAWATNMPVGETTLLRVNNAAAFIRSHAQAFDFMDSMTVMGISNQLYSQHNRGAEMNVTASITMKQDVFRDVSANKRINADAPNQYLWAYTDRFLNTPMFSSQFLTTTDTVPFLQLVLHGTMDMFSPHVNFSFNTEADILRMIDFNVFPSFLLTKSPSYLLAQTNSAHFFSTEFAQYKTMINDVFHTVNNALRYTAGVEWTNREVIAPGIIVNTYANGVRIIINYTGKSVTYLDTAVEALSARVVHDG